MHDSEMQQNVNFFRYTESKASVLISFRVSKGKTTLNRKGSALKINAVAVPARMKAIAFSGIL